MKYKHLIWDWNGTLFNDVFLCADIMNHLLKSRDLNKITLEKYRDVFTFPVIDYYKILGHDTSSDSFKQLSIEFIGEYEERKLECGLFSNAKETLSKIQERGISQSILSAYSQETLNEIITHFGLGKYFVNLVGLDNIYAASKLENGKKWMKELGFNKGEVLFVGDTVHDYEVATEINADCILFSKGHQVKKNIEVCSVPIINDLEELIEYI